MLLLYKTNVVGTGKAFISLGKCIIEVCQFITERRNIYQNIRALMRDIGLCYTKASKRHVGQSPEKRR